MLLKSHLKMTIITNMMIITSIMPLVVGEDFSGDNNGEDRGKITQIINLPRNIKLLNRNIRPPKGSHLQLEGAGASPEGGIIISQTEGGGEEGVASPSLERKLLKKGRTLRTNLWVFSIITAFYATKQDVDPSTLIVDILGGHKYIRQIAATA